MTNKSRTTSITPYPCIPKKLLLVFSTKLLYETPFKTIKDIAAKKNNNAVDLVLGLNWGSIAITISDANNTTPAKFSVTLIANQKWVNFYFKKFPGVWFVE